MKLIIQWSFVLLAFFSPTTFGFAKEKINDPKAVVYSLYKDFGWGVYFDLTAKDSAKYLGSGIIEQPHTVLSRYFDNELSALILKDRACVKKEKAICNLDFDILFNSQDVTAINLKITQKESGKVVVDYQNPSNNSKIMIEYRLKKMGSDWKITDIIYMNNGRVSLKELLSKK